MPLFDPSIFDGPTSGLFDTGAVTPPTITPSKAQMYYRYKKPKLHKIPTSELLELYGLFLEYQLLTED